MLFLFRGARTYVVQMEKNVLSRKLKPLTTSVSLNKDIAKNRNFKKSTVMFRCKSLPFRFIYP